MNTATSNIPHSRLTTWCAAVWCQITIPLPWGTTAHATGCTGARRAASQLCQGLVGAPACSRGLEQGCMRPACLARCTPAACKPRCQQVRPRVPGDVAPRAHRRHLASSRRLQRLQQGGAGRGGRSGCARSIGAQTRLQAQSVSRCILSLKTATITARPIHLQGRPRPGGQLIRRGLAGPGPRRRGGRVVRAAQGQRGAGGRAPRGAGLRGRVGLQGCTPHAPVSSKIAEGSLFGLQAACLAVWFLLP